MSKKRLKTPVLGQEAIQFQVFFYYATDTVWQQ